MKEQILDILKKLKTYPEMVAMYNANLANSMNETIKALADTQEKQVAADSPCNNEDYNLDKAIKHLGLHTQPETLADEKELPEVLRKRVFVIYDTGRRGTAFCDWADKKKGTKKLYDTTKTNRCFEVHPTHWLKPVKLSSLRTPKNK